VPEEFRAGPDPARRTAHLRLEKTIGYPAQKFQSGGHWVLPRLTIPIPIDTLSFPAAGQSDTHHTLRDFS
jgi:hypothetical protein